MEAVAVDGVLVCVGDFLSVVDEGDAVDGEVDEECGVSGAGVPALLLSVVVAVVGDVVVVVVADEEVSLGEFLALAFPEATEILRVLLAVEEVVDLSSL